MKKCNKRAELSGKTLTGTTVFVAIVALCMVAASMQSWAVTHGNIGADTGRIPDKGVRYRGIFINDESPRPASCAVEDGALVVRGVTAGGALKYEGRAVVRVKGGTAKAAGDKIVVAGADEATIYMAIATNYRNFRDLTGDPTAKCRAALGKALGSPYEKARAAAGWWTANGRTASR